VDTPGGRSSLKRRSTVHFEVDKQGGAEAGHDDDRKNLASRRGSVANKFRNSLTLLRHRSMGVTRESVDENGNSRSRGGSRVERGSLMMMENPFGVTSYSASAERSSLVSENPFGITSYSASPANPTSEDPQSRSGSKDSDLPQQRARANSKESRYLVNQRHSSKEAIQREGSKEASDRSVSSGQATPSQDMEWRRKLIQQSENQLQEKIQDKLQEKANDLVAREQASSPAPRRSSVTSREAGQLAAEATRGRRDSSGPSPRRNSATSREVGQSPSASPRRNSVTSREAGQQAAEGQQRRRNSIQDVIKGLHSTEGRRRSSSGWVNAKEVRFAVLNMAEKVEEDKEKAMYNVFIRTVELKSPVTTPVVEDVFRVAVAPLGLTQEDVHSLFKLSIMGKEQRVPIQDVILRAIGGLGYRYEKLRERLELPPQETKQETIRKRRESKFKLPEKGEYLDLGLNFVPSETLIRHSGNKKERMKGATFTGKKKTDTGNSLDHSSLMAGNKDLTRTPHGRMHQRNIRLSLKKSQFKEALISAGKHRPSQRDMSKMAIGASSVGSRKLAKQATVEELEGEEEEEDTFEVPSGAEGDGEDNTEKSNAAASGLRIDTGTSEESQSSSDNASPTSTLMKRRKSIHMERRKSVHQVPDTIDESESDSGRKPFKPNVPDLSSLLDVNATSPKASEGTSVDDVLGPRGRRASVLSKRVFGHFGKMSTKNLDKKEESKDKDKDQSKETFGLMEMSKTASSSEHSHDRQPRALLGGALQTLKFLSAAHSIGHSEGSKRETKGNALLSIGGAAESAEAWAFQADEEPALSPLSGALQDGHPTSPLPTDGRLTAGSSHSSATTGTEPTTPTAAGPLRDHQAEAAQVAAREQAEREHHLQRLSLFDGDAIELEIATRKLQELRGKLIAKYKSLPKAFDELAGSRNASITLHALQDRFVRLLKYNILDAERMAAIMATVEDISKGIGFASFLNIVRRFAAPAHTLLHFRARLVQRHGTIDAAFHVLGVRLDEELSIDLFERPMLGEGVVSVDARKLFRMVDAVQWKGPSGFLTLGTVRFVLDHAYVLAWLDIFNSRLGGRTGVRATFSKLPALQQLGGVEEPIDSASHLQSLLEPVGFASECVPALFDFLAHRTPQKVTIAGLLHIMHHAFEEHRHGASSNFHPDTGVTAGPTEAVRDRALTLTMQLRRRIMQQFANYQVAYEAFHAKRPDDGITMDEWEQAVDTFWSDGEKSSWALVFGHMCDFQHVRWDPKHKGSAEARINLSKFAAGLNGVAPCQSLSAFRHRLLSVEKCHSPAQAWVLFTGKDNAEEIHLTQWQHALLRNLNIPYEDAGRLFVLLRAIPCIVHSNNHQLLLRSTFMAGVRSQAAVDHNTLFQNLFLRLSKESGSISRAFEGHYPSEPLSLHDFQDKVGILLGCKEEDCRTFFLMLDNTRDALVGIDQFMEALTETQEVYLPYASVQVKDTEPDPNQNFRASIGHMRGSLISHLQRSHHKRHNVPPLSPSPMPASPSPPQDEEVRESILARKKLGDEGEELPSPSGNKTGSTMIPDDDSAVDSSADSGGEAAPRPQTVPADGNQHASGLTPDQRRLGPMPFLAGWEQRDTERPSTSPQQGNTDAGITGGGRRKSVHIRGQVQPAARPVPLAMALRNLVQQRRTDEDHNNLVYTSINAPDAAQPREPTSPVPALMPSTTAVVLAHAPGRRTGAGTGAASRGSMKSSQSPTSHRLSATGFTNLRGSAAGQSSGSAAVGRHSGADVSALDVLSGDLATPVVPLNNLAGSALRQKGAAKGPPIKMNMGNFLTGARSSQLSMNGSGLSSAGQQSFGGATSSVGDRAVAAEMRAPGHRAGGVAQTVRNWLLN